VAAVSGLKGTSYEEKLKELGLTTLEERRHQADMVQTFKILQGFDYVKSETWFQKVDTSGRMTRSAADPLNLKPQAARLEIRRNFFSNRAVEGWNLITSELRNARTAHFFTRAYRKHRAELVESAYKEMKNGSSQRRLPQLETRHLLRDPTWIIGGQPTSIHK
jgi:hypothetical protein